MPAPLVSIITASLNRAAMLAEAIDSVRQQELADYEHIIVDGCSSDGTAELLARHPHLTVIREQDRSVYDALNKGLRIASGEIIALLNSDDLLAPGALRRAVDALGDERVDVAVGAADVFEGGRLFASHSLPEDLRLSVRNITFGNPLPNARFYRRTLVQKAGEFDLRYRLGSDRDWLLRILRERPREAIIDASVYRYRRHAESLTINNHSKLAEPLWRECLAIAEDWLQRDGVKAEEREVLIAWHRQQTIQASLHFLRHGPWSRTAEFIRRGQGGRAWWTEWAVQFAKAGIGMFTRRGASLT